jgi:hypothetical protein
VAKSSWENASAMTRSFNRAVFLLCAVPVLAAPTSARAAPFSLAASGTISFNSSGDATIPVGTPWTFEIVYDTAAPDLDANSRLGSYGNTSVPPALLSFHYQAGGYEVAIDDAADFGLGSDILVDFGGAVNSIDVNVNAPALFPPLGGGAVSFHADFGDFSSRPIFASDALPTDPAFGPDSFDDANVSLLPASGGVVTGSTLTSFTVTPVPEPSTLALEFIGLVLIVAARRTLRPSAH